MSDSASGKARLRQQISRGAASSNSRQDSARKTSNSFKSWRIVKNTVQSDAQTRDLSSGQTTRSAPKPGCSWYTAEYYSTKDKDKHVMHVAIHHGQYVDNKHKFHSTTRAWVECMAESAAKAETKARACFTVGD